MAEAAMRLTLYSYTKLIKIIASLLDSILRFPFLLGSVSSSAPRRHARRSEDLVNLRQAIDRGALLEGKIWY
jgi:hypothetical protein